MTAGANIAARVAAGLARAGTRTATGPLTGTITRRGVATGPAYAPTYGAPTQHLFTAILGEWTAMERKGTSIAATDIKITASTMDIAPTASDTVIIAGVTYEIVEVMPVQPGGEVLLWEIAARK